MCTEICNQLKETMLIFKVTFSILIHLSFHICLSGTSLVLETHCPPKNYSLKFLPFTEGSSTYQVSSQALWGKCLRAAALNPREKYARANINGVEMWVKTVFEQVCGYLQDLPPDWQIKVQEPPSVKEAKMYVWAGQGASNGLEG